MDNVAARYFNSFASHYDSTTKSIQWRAPENVMARIKALGLDPAAPLKILDVGAGTGQLSLLLKQFFPNAEIHGADISPDMLDIAVRNGRLEPVHVYAANLSHGFPYPDNEFDLVASAGAAEYIGPAEEILKEMARVIKPGGFIVSTFRTRSPANQTMLCLNILRNSIPGLEPVPFKNLTSAKNLINAARRILTDPSCSAPYNGFIQSLRFGLNLNIRYVTFSGQKSARP